MPQWLHSWWTHWRNIAAPTQLLAATFQSLATAIGIIVGAVWALNLFFRKREHFPRLNVEHHVVDWRVGDSTILRATIRAENKGNVIAQIRRARVWVQQILPTPDDIAAKIANGEDPMKPGESEIQWPLATDVVRECDWTGKPEEIEPSETGQFYFDFVLPEHVRAVQVYSFLQNDTKARDFGWNTTTVHALTGVRVLSASVHELIVAILIPSAHQPMRARRTDGGFCPLYPEDNQPRRDRPPYRAVA